MFKSNLKIEKSISHLLYNQFKKLFYPREMFKLTNQ